jgi:ABC-type multidrug transport system fused ATPase/permease subunit
MNVRKQIEVSEEMLQEKIKRCGTFSHEYLDALTDEQWDQLRKGRQARIASLRGEVRRNEQKLGIWDTMEEYRALRLNLIALREREIRDLYFGIEDRSFRLKAINDLYDYELALSSYYRNAIRLEAWNRFEAARKRRTAIDWERLLKDFFVSVVGFGFWGVFLYLIFIFLNGHRLGDGILGWITVLALVIFAQMTVGAFNRWMNALIEERESLMEYKVASMRDGFDGSYSFVRDDFSAIFLFSEKERLTGKREGVVTDERRREAGY